GRSHCPEGTIQQESPFWRRSLWNKAGGTLDTSLKLAADFELWARFFQHADLYGVNCPLGGFRIHQDQKTTRHLEAYADEAEQVLSRYERKVERPVSARLHRLLRQVRWPQRILQVGTRLGMREPRKICVHQENGWRIESR
ncbi:MAG: glycosyltransferase, partial [Planctomycetes bacterium]|nr:glycosyltransferase [Planctomycetota bacterium]